MASIKDPPVLEALLLKDNSPGGATAAQHRIITTAVSTTLKCVLCDSVFYVAEDKNDFLKHLLTAHKLVIGDVKYIADFTGFV